MFTGVCKLTVDAIVLGNSNGSLHGYNLVVMAWHCRNTLFFCNSFQNNNILNCSRLASTNQIILHKQVSFWHVYAQKG